MTSRPLINKIAAIQDRLEARVASSEAPRLSRLRQELHVPTRDLSNLPKEHDNRITRPRNRLDGTILAVKKDMLVAQVEMACGPYRIVSLISREAADELDLKPGDQATAIVKSAAVFIEPTDRQPLSAVT